MKIIPSVASPFVAPGNSNATVSTDETISGNFNGSDYGTAVWPDGGSGQGNQMDDESDLRTDGDQATITAHQNGTMDASGNITLTGENGSVNGTDQFGEKDKIDAPEYADPNYAAQSGSQADNEEVTEVDGSSGSDSFNVSEAADGNGNMTSIKDKETIGDTVKDTVTLTPLNGGPVSGSASLGGGVVANINQTGNATGGTFTMNPVKGDDTVNLNGNSNYHDSIQANGYGPDGTAHWINTQQPAHDSNAPLWATQSTITTDYTDSGLSFNEKDTEAGATTTINSVNLSDTPKSNVLATFTYGRLNPGIAGSGSGKLPAGATSLGQAGAAPNASATAMALFRPSSWKP